MPARPYFLPDKLESLVRKCIVFPADGSETRVVHMIARTVTEEDPSALRMYSRCVDMTSTFGDDYRKIRVMAHRTAQAESYLFFYNLSPNLPINRAITYILEVTPSYLKTRKHLFWRGDVVVMKVQPQSEQMDFMVESLDADMVELEILEEFFRETYQGGVFGRLLHYLEYQCEQETRLIFSRLKKNYRGFVSLGLLWAYLLAVRRFKNILGSKRNREGR